MTHLRIASLALALAALPLAGCAQKPEPAAGSLADATAKAAAEATHATSMIGRQVEREIAKARAELRTRDISIGHGNGGGVDFNGRHSGASDKDLPEAAITPRGDLVVAGRTVPVTAAQRTMLLAYREQLVGVAEAGMAIGAKGADLAGTAVTEALGSIFGGGDKRRMEDRIEAQAQTLKDEAKLICTRLPALLDAQRKLAAAVPEFRPYADMTQEDVDDCASDIDRDGVWSTK